MSQMTHKKETVIGVVGGMGPEATASFFYKLIRSTPVEKDQDHYRIVIDNNPSVPDRTQAIFGEAESPVPTLVETAKNVEAAGADVLAIPCVTSYYFMDEVQEEVSIPIVDLFRAVSEYLTKELPETKKVGVLCTSGTRKTGLFHNRVKGFDVFYPSEETQEANVMEAIYGKNGIKQGNTGEHPKQLLQEAAQELIAEGADVVISGCTEIELALKPEDISVPLIDPMQVVAEVLTDENNPFLLELLGK